MDNVLSAGVSVTGVGLIAVGEKIVDIGEKAAITIVQTDKPSILMLDLTGGIYDYAFTIGNLLTTLGLCCAVLGVAMGVNNYYAIKRERKHKRRKGDK